MLIVYAPIIIAFLYVLVLRDEGYSQVSLPKPAQQILDGGTSERASTVARARDPPVELLHWV